MRNRQSGKARQEVCCDWLAAFRIWSQPSIGGGPQPQYCAFNRMVLISVPQAAKKLRRCRKERGELAPFHRPADLRSADRDLSQCSSLCGTEARPLSATLVGRRLVLWCPQAFLISIFCCFFATSAGFGRRMCSTPLSNFAWTWAGSGSNGRGIARLNEP